MKNYKLIIAFICFFAVAFGSSPICNYSISPLQMAAIDFKKVHNYYNTNPSISVDTYYMAFDDHNSVALREGKPGCYIKNKTDYYTKILNLETLCLSDMIINVDHEDKMIVIGDNQPDEVNPFFANIDSIFYLCSDVNYKNLATGERKYILDLSDTEYSEYDKVEVTLDIKNNRINKISFYYRMAMNLTGDYGAEGSQPRLEIAYKNYRTTIANKYLLEKTAYIQELNDKIMPANKFKAYKVLDQRKKTRI
ncbi:MAG: hypothetical protein H0W73_17110 [Bacteroidetes bacterium]|nr:hypothetical protein [Bacteroidota bacterium]